MKNFGALIIVLVVGCLVFGATWASKIRPDEDQSLGAANFTFGNGGYVDLDDGATFRVGSDNDLTATHSSGTTTLSGDVTWANTLSSQKEPYTVLDTNDTTTLTVAQSGIYLVTNGTGTTTVNLPSAAAGLIYHILDGSATAGDDIIVDVQTGDSINGDSAGDGITCTTDADGQSVSLLAVDDVNWVTVHTFGTWAEQ